MTLEDQVLTIASQHHIGVFFDARARRNGVPWIFFKRNGICLAEFHGASDALAWFPSSQNHSLAANGELIPSVANI